MLEWLTKDGKLLLSARIARSFSYGFLSIVLAIYLKLIGFNDFLIGIVITASLVNSVIFTLVASFYADKIGRHKMLMLYAVLMSISGTLSRAYLLALGNTLRIFFQLSCTSLISRKSLADLTQLFMVPAEISPRSALARSDDRKAIILFSASAGLLFANSIKASGDLASTSSKNRLAFFHKGRVLLDF